MARFSFRQSSPWFEFAPAIETAPRFNNQRQGDQPWPTTVNQSKLPDNPSTCSFNLAWMRSISATYSNTSAKEFFRPMFHFFAESSR
jgi:hypothetical protein